MQGEEYVTKATRAKNTRGLIEKKVVDRMGWKIAANALKELENENREKS